MHTQAPLHNKHTGSHTHTHAHIETTHIQCTHNHNIDAKQRRTQRNNNSNRNSSSRNKSVETIRRTTGTGTPTHPRKLHAGSYEHTNYKHATSHSQCLLHSSLEGLIWRILWAFYRADNFHHHLLEAGVLNLQQAVFRRSCLTKLLPHCGCRRV